MKHSWLKSNPKRFLQTVLKSRFLKKAFAVAVVIASKRKEAMGFVNKADHKINRKENLQFFALIKDKINVTFRMLKFYFKGEYKSLSWNMLLKILAGIIYFVFLIDFVPDFLPVIGLADDVLVLTWVINSIGDELNKFELWEAQKMVDELDIQLA
jgi:uncharacterized membrane protein YkvA (DUF1232 family)